MIRQSGREMADIVEIEQASVLAEDVVMLVGWPARVLQGGPRTQGLGSSLRYQQTHEDARRHVLCWQESAVASAVAAGVG